MSQEPLATCSIRVIVTEDDARMRDILVRHLERMGYAVRAAADAAATLELLRGGPAEVVLSDVRMPGMDGLTLLQVLRQKWPELRVVLMTAFGSVDAAVAAMQAGAYSYVTKPFKVEEVAAVLRNATREVTLTRQLARLDRAVRTCFSVERLIGNSAAMQEVRRQVREAACLSAPVLITGRSGTGKELAARAIHHSGPRSAGPFVPVNCAAIPETLFESEMFGHQRGAFSGATDEQPGILEQSSGGTLFLDEVGEIPRPQQAKFLRVLEEREVRRLGASKARPVDLRVICATNRDLNAMVKQGDFREDLYFRLNVLEVRMPELAARPEDIGPLADHLLAELVDATGVPCHGFEPEALELLAAQNWPGNVRELRNIVERAMVRAGARRISAADLPAELRRAPLPRGGPSEDGPRPQLLSLAELERGHIAEVLTACGWNRSLAAQVLGIDRRTLFSKIQRYGLVGPDGKAVAD